MRQSRCYKYDFILLAVIAIICVSVFGHPDILTTASHSLAYLGQYETEGIRGIIDIITGFYTNAKSYSMDTGSNYLPSTFIVFALWNLPLKMVWGGVLPESAGDYTIPFILWNKALPMFVYLLSCLLLYNVCKKDFELDEDKSMIAVLAFASSGIAFFSQFFFCQYDIFIVFFMLLGVHFYFNYFGTENKREWILFILSFAVAASFKYYALLILGVMLVIKEKNAHKIVLDALFGCSIILIEGVFYFLIDRDSFREQVLEFPVLSYVESSAVSVGTFRIQMLPFLCFVILLILYRIHPKDKESYIRCFVWGSCLICLALFGFMVWHPQWLLFAVPFWTLAMVYSHDRDTLIYLDIIMTVAFIGFVVQRWINNVDQNLLKYGIFMELFRYRKNLPDGSTMAKFFPIDSNILYSVIVAIMVGYCIWSYPWNEQDQDGINVKHCILLLRFRFLIGLAAFVVPAVLCVPDLLNQDELAWSGWRTAPDCRYATNYLTENEDVVIQKLTGIEGRISEIDVYTVVTGINAEGMILSVEVMEEETEKVVVTAELKDDINTCKYSKIYFEDSEVLEYDKNYLMKFYANVESSIQLACVEYQKGNVIIDQYAKKREHMAEGVFHNDKWLDQATLQMNIYTAAN